MSYLFVSFQKIHRRNIHGRLEWGERVVEQKHK